MWEPPAGVWQMLCHLCAHFSRLPQKPILIQISQFQSQTATLSYGSQGPLRLALSISVDADQLPGQKSFSIGHLLPEAT